MTNKKIIELDVLRAICALAVIAIHVTADYTNIKSFSILQITLVYINNISQFSVSGFIFISGISLYNKYNNLSDICAFYRTRFIKIMPTYLIFSIFYLCFSMVIIFFNTHKIEINLIKIFYRLLTGGAFYHLWYFCILFQFYLAYPFLLFLYKKNYKIVLLSTFLIQYIWGFFGKNIIDFFISLLGHDSISIPFIFSNIFLFVLSFFFLEKKEKILNYINIKISLFLVISINIIRTLPYYYGLQYFSYETIPT